MDDHSLMVSSTTHFAGFGEYQEVSTPLFTSYQTAQKTHALITATLLGSAATAATVVAIVSFSWIWVSGLIFLAIIPVAIHSWMKYTASKNMIPPSLTSDLNPHHFGARCVGERIQENGSALVLSDAIETKKYKLDLIRHAQSSIFLSCYMGEEALDEALDLIKERLEQKKDLKVFLLGSDHFLTSENKKRLDFLTQTYPDQFFAVMHPEVHFTYHPTEGKLHPTTTNHIKLTAIDQGSYFIVGGSALRPYWTDHTGTEDLQLHQAQFDPMNLIEAKGFRDMDFVFKSESQGAGFTSFLEGAKLMVHYAYLQDPSLAERLKIEFLTLARTPAPLTQVPSYDSRTDQVHRLDMKLYATGPLHKHNDYLHALIDHIRASRHKIVIAQMYFHPPQELLDALIEAAGRGVEIEIITNSKEKQAPGAHHFFMELGAEKYKQLFTCPGHSHVRLHEYNRANTTYHKKIVVIDGEYTAFGSSNFGYKSLNELPSDFEFNGMMHSQAFAAQTLRVLDRDISYSQELTAEKGGNPSWDVRLKALLQEWTFAPFAL